MQTTLSFGASVPAFGAATAGRVKPRPRSGPYAAFAPPAPQSGAGVVAEGVRDPILPILAEGFRPSRLQRVDSLVTIAIMAWLAVALAIMAGELLL